MTDTRHPSQNSAPVVDVILPAGGKISGAFAEATQTEIKALIHWRGKTLLQKAIEAFQETGVVRRIVVIGEPKTLEVAAEHGAEGRISAGASGPENIFRGLEWLQAQPHAAEKVVIATTDLPFLTAQSILHFLAACDSKADISAPVVAAEAFETRFPNSGSVYVPLKGGAVTLGCVFQLAPQTLLRARPHIEKLFEARKNQFALARIVGVSTLARLATRRLKIEHLEARCQSVLGCKGIAVRDAAPELAYDLDTLEDYRLALAQSELGKDS